MEQDREETKNAYGEEKQDRVGLFASSEGRMLAIVLALVALYFVWLGLGWPGVPQKFRALMGFTATLVFLGRAAGMSLGYAMGLDHSVVVPLSMIVETLTVLMFYPLFVLSWRRLLVIKPLGNIMERTHRVAENHRGTIDRYGIPGLMFFVWFPFFMTGPVIGCAIGFLLGLRMWITLTVVLIGTYVSIATWAMLLGKIHERVVAYNPYAPVILVAIAIVILAGIYVLRTIHPGRNSAKR